MFGLLNINKPVGPTSFGVVAQVRRLVGGRKTKVGHAGTLDPFADGVLVVCIGAATRLADYVQQQTKGYRAVMMLGAVSDTHDTEGQITQTPNAGPVDIDEIKSILKTFVGKIDQVPPAHSAVHVDGKRAYDLARAGHKLDLPPREVNIYRVDLVQYDYPHLTIDVSCGAGTYIRSLARDIGEKLKVGAYCTALTRTAIGRFDLANAVNLDDIDPPRDMIDPIAALDALTKIPLDAINKNRIAMGKTVTLPTAVEDPTPTIAVTDLSEELIALASLIDSADGQLLKPSKVFIQPQRSGDSSDC
jgi:tRNA pseudouridine55 synthase